MVSTISAGINSTDGVANIEVLDAIEKLIGSFREGVGRAIITSSQVAEKSYESDDLQNGYFTYYLIEALKSGRLGGVGLDVYEEEEGVFFEDLSGQILQDDDLARLLTFPNVLITAHQAFLTREALAEIARVTVTNLTAFAEGKPFLPDTVVK